MIELLKDYLKRLGRGEPLETVRADFVQNFKDVDASEIMQAEQQLIREGTPITEVQKLCDVHSALFHGKTREEKIANAEKAVDASLIRQERASKTKLLVEEEGHPLYTFTKENEALAVYIEQARAAIAKGEVSQELVDHIREVAIHYAKKGDLLYPHLKVGYQISGPSDVMWTVDDEIRDELAVLSKKSAHDKEWLQRFDAVVTRVDEMIYKEQNILFPNCAVNFTEDEWIHIYHDAKDYADCFGVTPAIWEKAETVKVTYHIDEQSEIVLKNPGDRLYSPITPTRDDGLIFYGWSASADSSEVLPYATTVTKATEVYAVWGEGFEWNFDTDGDTENTTPDQITGVTVQDGALRGTTSGNDPKIFLRFIADFGHFNTVVVQGTANSENEADGAWFQVYAALDKKPLAEERSVNKKFTYTDGLSELRYSLYNDMRVASSYKNITFFRLDPGSRSDINLCIERIFVIPDVPAAALFDAADGTGQMPRILPDTNGYITLPENIFTHSYKEFEAWTDGTNTFLPGTKVKIDGFVTFRPKWKEGKINDLDTEFYPGFTKKAFVLSYDDGVDHYDRILLGRLNNAGYVGSFNIITSYWDSLTEEQLDAKRTMYAGHEIANHSDTHPQMFGKDSTTGEFLFTEEECINDIVLGKEKLEKVFGYEVVGLAWPFTIPSTRPNIRKHVRENYIYARGSGDSYNFNIPASFVDEWTFTIYEARYKGGLLEYTRKYQTYDSDALSLFSVWGHSFDFTNGTNPAITYAEYDEFLTLCKTIDMWNPTCADYVRYVNAHRKMVIDYENVYNPSELTQYIQANGIQIELPAGARYDGETIHCNTAVAAESEIRVTVNLDTRKATGAKASALAAAYDASGKLMGVKAYEIPSGKIQMAALTLPSSSGAATVKVFLFNDLTAFSPLEDVKIIPVTAE